ncbi:MAG: hypothetical protein LBR56_01295 [Sporomusaceae bacterium]|nr:hypothetical protein [Sporomusaceae bacterium]
MGEKYFWIGLRKVFSLKISSDQQKQIIPNSENVLSGKNGSRLLPGAIFLLCAHFV